MTRQLSIQALQVGISEPEKDMGREEIHPQASSGREENHHSVLLHSENKAVFSLSHLSHLHAITETQAGHPKICHNSILIILN